MYFISSNLIPIFSTLELYSWQYYHYFLVYLDNCCKMLLVLLMNLNFELIFVVVNSIFRGLLSLSLISCFKRKVSCFFLLLSDAIRFKRMLSCCLTYFYTKFDVFFGYNMPNGFIGIFFLSYSFNTYLYAVREEVD